MSTALAHVSPQIALVVGAAIVLVTALFVRQSRQWWGAPMTLVVLAVAAVLTVDLSGGGQQITFDQLWALDHVTGIATLVILSATAVVVLLARQWFDADVRHGEVYVLLLFGALGATVLAGAADLNELVVGVTLSSVTGYVLAAYHRGAPTSVEAGIKYFLVGGLANVTLLIGVVLIFGAAGTTLYADLGARLADGGTALLLPGSVLTVVGLTFKLGAAPAHSWLPDVAQGAPVPSAAFLTVVPKIGAFVAVSRFVMLLPQDASGWRPMIAVLAVLTMTLGNLAALQQDDVRRLLGWSSVSQSGYALMAVAALGRSDQALPALLLFLAAYAAGNLTCFAVVAQLRGRTSIEDHRGLVSSRPGLVIAMTVGMLSLVGIPPLAGFGGKLTLFAATIDAGLAWVAVAAVINTVISLAYYLRVIAVMVDSRQEAQVHVLGRWAAGGVAVATVATVVVGIGARIVLDLASAAVLLP